jgi:ABC-type glycerol-3-phosphate transport system substrate-binding protein
VDLSLIADLGAGVILGDPARYGLPFDFTGSVIGYNKTVLDKYGVAYPKEGWTTDDLQQAAITLTRDINDKSPADADFDPSNIKMYGVMLQNSNFWGAMVNMWGARLWSEDGKTCTFDSPNGMEAFTYWNDLACAKHAVYGPQPTAQAGSGDPFVSQLAAISIEGEWQLALWKDITDFDFDVAAWPNGPRENWQYGASDALGIAKDSKDVDAAWEFEKFWIWNKDAALATGSIMPPALNDLGLDEGMLQARIGERGPTMENLEWAYANMRQRADGSVYYQGIRPDEWQPVFSEMLTTLLTLCNEPVDPLVPDTAKQITDILQKT